jgi:hypothetical protein
MAHCNHQQKCATSGRHEGIGNSDLSYITTLINNNFANTLYESLTIVYNF